MLDLEQSRFCPVENQEEEEGCPVMVGQTAGVCVPVTISPYVRMGHTHTIRYGEPVIGPGACGCAGTKNGSCSFTVTQDIRVCVPLEFCAYTQAGDVYVSDIGTAARNDDGDYDDGCGDCGDCGCGCCEN